jgi:hypothetical protein
MPLDGAAGQEQEGACDQARKGRAVDAADIHAS